MSEDCTEEFKRLNRRIDLYWIFLIGYLIVVSVLFDVVSSNLKWESSSHFYAFCVIFFGLLLLLWLISPRCPSCGRGLYSIIEFRKFPILIKSRIGKSCLGCGARLRT